jgi:hypothetical protein
VVLSVKYIFASALKSVVLPPNAVAVAAIVARFQVGGDLPTPMPQPVPQPSKLAAKPHLLTIDFREPSAIAVMRPQHTSRIFESAVQIRVSTHVHALVQGHGSQLVHDRGHVDGSTTLLWGRALHHKFGIPALLLGCPSGRAAACIVCTHLAALERSAEAREGDGGRSKRDLAQRLQLIEVSLGSWLLLLFESVAKWGCQKGLLACLRIGGHSS